MKLSTLSQLTPAEARGVKSHFGVWALEERAARVNRGLGADFDLCAHIAEQRRVRAASAMPLNYGEVPTENVAGSVKLIHAVGELSKYGSSFVDGPSTLALREEVRRAANDPHTSGIVLLIDSPGGHVAGVGDLADDIFRVRGKKPIVAYLEDLAASAAYWIASQATKVLVNPSGFVGGVGVYSVVEDLSQAAEAAGVRVEIVKAGAYKGALSPGAPVDDAALSEVQRQVDATNELFVAAVARGRAMKPDAVRALATGQLFGAAEAQRLGLVDEVADLDRAIELAGGGSRSGDDERRATRASIYADWRGQVKSHQSRGLSFAAAVAEVEKVRPGLRQIAYDAMRSRRS